jgi:hypothetical protein
VDSVRNRRTRVPHKHAAIVPPLAIPQTSA